ncbi:MAG TPA: class I tRNA ligase family protein, partial [Candidatus Dojkabacteria bacterium]|nr:class I tRNA ligase family protein [Candidatus Dojkabacteria bacterium]
MKKNSFNTVDSKPNFPQIEDKITSFWKENDLFRKSINERPVDNRYSFTDGPPFVSGMPHYGHLLTSIAKDVVPRYWTMKGKRVRRVFGWDCHGLPVEAKVNKKLGIKTRKQVENELGVEKYIKECRSYVEQNISDWRWYIEKIGRWVDLDEPYYTMYPKFNESVIWAFKQMWEKGLVYKGKRVSLYSTDTMTPVSDFEVAMDPDNYQDTQDLSVFVKFKLKYHKTGLGVGVVIENEKGEILTAQRNEPGRAKLIGIVGGKKDETDKDLFETVSRECLEEIGIVPEDIELTGSSVDIFEGRMFHTHHFKAKLNSKTKFTTCDAMTDLKWVSKDKLPWDNMHIPTKNCLLDVLGLKKFPKIEQQKPDVYLVAWTTTPWTIPSNFALCVNPDFDYGVYKNNNEFIIVSTKRAEYTFGKESLKEKKDVKKFYEFKGKEFAGIKYESIYDFFSKESNENDYQIYNYEGVSNDDGTGILHVAPAFGEEDHNLGLEHDLSSHSDIDEEGKMTIGEWKGIYLRKASTLIAEDMKNNAKLFKSEVYTHRLPYYRGENPLIYMAQEAYFLKLDDVKKRMLELNKDVNWVPKTFGTKRFVEVIKTAPDWCISRNRYWGTIMPLWKSKDGEELVVGSIEEMMNYTKQIIKEKGEYKLVKKNGSKEKMMLHRDTCDEIVLTKDGKKYYRVHEILDVWLDSGSVPFAEHHYPFENQQAFEQSFPADFIVEYTAQLRAWFNVLFRVSTIIFDKEPFKNVLCHGTLAGNDGRKMSKTYGNYPDPEKLLKTTGGEAFRLYMMGMPIMAGEDSDWSDTLLQDQLKLTLIPLWNVYKYFVIYAQLHNFKPQNTEFPNKNILDRWIKSYMDNITIEYSKAMEKYDIPSTVKLIRPAIDTISTWYIRRSRDRFVNGDIDALQTLYSTIVQLIKTFAPQIVFITEEIYQNLVVGILPSARES